MAKIVDIQEVSLKDLKPYKNNAKIHSEEQVEKICASIDEFGFVSPCLVDKDFNLIAGHGRVMAAERLGLEKVPCVFIEGLSDAQRRAYILADNKLTELGGWDEDLLNEELRALYEEDFNIDVTGFDFDFKDPSSGFSDYSDEELTDPLAVIPESKMYVCAISAFGTDSEKVLLIPLDQETADHVLEADADVVSEKIVRCLNDL